MKKSLLHTYADIRSAIAFIMRNERGLSKHTITEAALAATKVIHRANHERLEETKPPGGLPAPDAIATGDKEAHPGREQIHETIPA